MLIADLGALPRATDLVYLMVRPDPPAATRLAELGRRLNRLYESPGRPFAEDRLHTTLFKVCPFGRLAGKALPAIDDALAEVAMRPFLYGLDLVTNFGDERRPAVVVRGDEGTPGLLMLQDETAVTMRKIGFRVRRCTPHVTLGYGPCRVPELPVDEIRWTVRGFSLVCSLHGRHKHVSLAHWPLHG